MRARASGSFYVEVLVAVAILALALVPLTNALYAGMRSADYFVDSTELHFDLLGLMDALRAQPFAALDAAAITAGSHTIPTTYSDSPGIHRKLVYLARYDADNADGDNNPFTGGEAEILWLRVAIEGTDRGLETLLTP